MDAIPPDDSTPESRDWDRWTGTVKAGDKVEAKGVTGTVTLVNDDFIRVCFDGQKNDDSFEWYDVGPVEVVK